MPKLVIYLIKFILLFAVYFITAKVGLSLDAVSGFATLVWAPTGIALAALLLFGIKFWPGIFLAAFFVNFSTGAPLLVAVGMGVGNTLEAVIGAYLIKKFTNLETFLDHLKDVFILIFLAALFSTAVSATIGTASLYLGGVIPVSKLADTWTAWWIGDMLGNLIILPLIIAWSRFSLPVFNLKYALELLAHLIIVTFTDLFIFLRLFTNEAEFTVSRLYFIFPVLLWTAVRFEKKIVTAVIAFTSVVAIVATVRGVGPFAISSSTLSFNLSNLQIFLAILSTLILSLFAIVTEKKKAVEILEVSANEKEDIRRKLEVTAMELKDKAEALAETAEDKESIRKKLEITATELKNKATKLATTAKEKEAVREKLVVTAEELSKSRKMLERKVLERTKDLEQARAKDEAIRKLAEAERLKDEFLAIASHELKTPLVVLRGNASMILDGVAGPINQDIRNMVSGNYEEVKRMIRLVNNFLDISRLSLDLSKNIVEIKPVDIVGIVKKIVAELEIEAKKSGTNLRIVTPRGNFPQVMADADGLEQSLYNLVGNALKYTPKGTIEVSFRDSKGEIKTLIKDTGTGISKKYQEKIFDKFTAYRSGIYTRTSRAGTGLGLYISRNLVEKMGGKLYLVESKEGRGSTFALSLPKA